MYPHGGCAGSALLNGCPGPAHVVDPPSPIDHVTLTGSAVKVTDRVPTAAVADTDRHCTDGSHNHVGNPTYVVPDAPPFDCADIVGNINFANAICAIAAAGGVLAGWPGGGVGSQRNPPLVDGPPMKGQA